jgi:putative RNA 2'-phosphotransferase
MYDNEQTSMSKFLTLLLRHHPEYLDLTMDEHGWVAVNELLEQINRDRINKLYLSQLRYVVKTDNKQRFEIKKENGVEYIRAQYGHSIRVDLQHEEIEPPEILYHGTATKYLDKIKEFGILHRGRQFVHLTEDKKVAAATGSRHGTPVVLQVSAKKMYDNSIVFYKAPNGIWLTKYVEKEYVKEDSEKK